MSALRSCSGLRREYVGAYALRRLKTMPLDHTALSKTKISVMTKHLLIYAASLMAASLNAADSSPKDEIQAAAKKLGEKANYSWKTTVVVPEGQRYRPGPSEGKTEKGGFTHVTWTFGDNTLQTVLKGEKGAVTNQEGTWESLADVEKEEGVGRFRAMLARSFKAPAEQAAELAAATTELKKDDDVYSGILSELGAKEFLRAGRSADQATVTDASGSVKFWLKDGAITKYEFRVKGTVNNNDRERTTTIEIKDVGTTKLDIPDEAKKKLG